MPAQTSLRRGALEVVEAVVALRNALLELIAEVGVVLADVGALRRVEAALDAVVELLAGQRALEQPARACRQGEHTCTATSTESMFRDIVPSSSGAVPVEHGRFVS